MEQQELRDLANLIISKKLGSGAFGEIYLADNLHPNQRCADQQVAVKIERSDTKHPQIDFETKLYKYLNQHQHKNQESKGIPRIFCYICEQGYNFMIMELLGKSLEDLFTQNNSKFSLRTVALLGIQMIDSIEFIHQKQYIHRDIKPDNFLIGVDEWSYKLFIVDFGLAKRYISKEGHIPYKENKSLTGTARYASINTHLGIEQSRRDDLESLGYVLMYLLRGNLPWQNLRASTQKEKYERIMEKKLTTSTDTLCRGYPEELFDFMNYCKNIKFDQKPDYSYLKGLFQQILIDNEYELIYVYDWDDEDTLNRVRFILENNNNLQEKGLIENKIQNQQKNDSIINDSNYKIMGQNVYNNSMLSRIQKSMINQERFPQIKQILHPQANELILQLQQQQKQLQNFRLNSKQRKAQYSLSQNNHQELVNQNLIGQNQLVPTKTTSIHSIVQGNQNQILASQPKLSQDQKKQQNQLIQSYQVLYRTLYPSKQSSLERNPKNTRQLKSTKKFTASYKNSGQFKQQSFIQ